MGFFSITLFPARAQQLQGTVTTLLFTDIYSVFRGSVATTNEQRIGWKTAHGSGVSLLLACMTS